MLRSFAVLGFMAKAAVAQPAVTSVYNVYSYQTTLCPGLAAVVAGRTLEPTRPRPANIGDYLVIYMTGLGLATPNGDPKGTPLPSGQNPPLSGNPLYETPTMPTVTIGGIPVTPAFSGLSPGFAGEYQVVVQVPPGVASSDKVPVVITMMGQSDTANISIQPSRIKPPNQ